MSDKRYRIEIQANDSSTWEPAHYTNSLPVAKRHVAAMGKSGRARAARVVNRVTGQGVAVEAGGGLYIIGGSEGGLSSPKSTRSVFIYYP